MSSCGIYFLTGQSGATWVNPNSYLHYVWKKLKSQNLRLYYPQVEPSGSSLLWRMPQSPEWWWGVGWGNSLLPFLAGPACCHPNRRDGLLESERGYDTDHMLLAEYSLTLPLKIRKRKGCYQFRIIIWRDLNRKIKWIFNIFKTWLFIMDWLRKYINLGC